MKTHIVVLSIMLALSVVAVAVPPASADICNDDAPETVQYACGVAQDSAGYAMCYYNTAPSQWATTCV